MKRFEFPLAVSVYTPHPDLFHEPEIEMMFALTPTLSPRRGRKKAAAMVQGFNARVSASGKSLRPRGEGERHQEWLRTKLPDG
jgi:hypothetical protein